MKNRVTVKIAGQSYTVVSEDAEDYIKQIAEAVDKEIEKMSNVSGITHTQALVLAACNLADEKMKTAQTLDNLRGQMKGYLEDASTLRSEISELRRENMNLKRRVGDI